MPLYNDLQAPAHTLGLDLSSSHTDPQSPEAITLTRHGLTLTLNAQSFTSPAHTDPQANALHQRFLSSAILTGIRLALDQTEITRQLTRKPTTPPAGRPQPQVVRYHEVASVYGDRLLRLLPSLSLDWCEAITQTPLYRIPWIQPGLEIAFVEESGRTLDLLTYQQATTHPNLDKLLRDARAALFYDSYRVRPSRHYDLPCGTIRVIKTTEGLGASRALILPEYDWNASQDHGFLAVPDRDTLLIAHPASPQDPHSRAELHANLVRLTQKHLQDATFPLSNQTFALHIDQTQPHPQPPSPLPTRPLPTANNPAPPSNLTMTPSP